MSWPGPDELVPAPSPAISAGGRGSGWLPRYSCAIASTRCHFGVFARSTLPATSSARSTTSRSSGSRSITIRDQRFSSSSAAAAPSPRAAATSPRTVSRFARSTHSASESPTATTTMAIAFLRLTSPDLTAARSTGRVRRSRASFIHSFAVRGASESSSRA